MLTNKPTLRQLQEIYGLHALDLARAAGVEIDLVYLMLRGIPVAQQEAEQVLTGLSKLTRQHYALSDLDVPLLEEDAV